MKSASVFLIPFFIIFENINLIVMAKKLAVIKWLKQPEAQDYPGALSFLSLIYTEEEAEKLVRKMKKAKITHFKSKDIFRASALPILGEDNYHVAKGKKKIDKGTALSPMLLVRDGNHGRVIIADGYHRLCAVYLFNEDAVIPCKIV